MKTGYFTDDINWSVRKVNGTWCLVCRGEHDEEAKTEEQKKAIEDWKLAVEQDYDRAIGYGNAPDRYL